MGELLPTYDQIIRILLVGLIFASSVFVGFFMCWWPTNHQSKRQDMESEFLQKKIDEL